MKESRMKMKRNARRRRRAVQSPGARDRSTEVCRLCHGQTPRSIAASHAPAAFPLFCSDFHRLLGVRMKRDPDLSRFICERCHEEFYRCQRVLEEFRRRANQRPDAHRSDTEEASSKLDLAVFRPLHSLVSWAHSHAAFGCSSCPDLREALRSRCGASVTLLWSCEDGHGFQIDTPSSNQLTDRELQQNEEEEEQQQQTVQRSEGSGDVEEQNYSWSLETQPCGDLSPPDAAALIHTEGADSELSDRILLSEEECEEQRRSSSCEEGNAHNHRGGCKEQGTLEPRPRRKPGPKPGWKNHSKALREELPTIFKCPHQGCTAVYRGADGMKKHIKEHHEEVRERPCPHPGCNKVFMIDRYLQRHLKLIHTEERNYICDQCGQTFKQRKHLSVHQMRHSGAKPLQCEVCGFQCRQRASLKYHMTKHKAEAELEFGCQICSKRFEKAHNLNVHMSMVHPLLQNTITEHSGPAQHADTHSGPAQHADTHSGPAQHADTHSGPAQHADTHSGPAQHADTHS